ncbi:MAG: UDP-N-acetylmuramoyl-tripeptide--D-alanyl-D-alanine ligase [Planctomycetota bacterium]|jgi:UDP-N-acetylmuramoyl-tripeptide--D-alanyl-D-alanine ligase
MKSISIQTLAEIINAQNRQNITGLFTGVSIDSRTIQPGQCFFAVPGENFDGHNYIKTAFEKGAACAVVSARNPDDFQDKAILKVTDTVKALGLLGAAYRRQCAFKVVAITGSAGKTTTRQIAYHAISRDFRVTQSPKNFNNFIGLPLTLLAAQPNDQIVITELGTNYPGEIAYLSNIAQPDIAIVTNAYQAHLEGLGNLETVIKEKLSIYQGLSPDGVFIINADCPGLMQTCEKLNRSFITFGKTEQADINAKNIIHAGRQSSFTIDDTRICLPLPGPGNLENALAAWAICKNVGMIIDDFALAISSLNEIHMRAEILEIDTLTVINDCYNANPASMKNALAILSSLNTDRSRRVVFICGDMAELGDKSQQLHAELGSIIAETGVNVLLTVGSFGKITTQAVRSANRDLLINCFEDTDSLCNNLEKFIKNSDIVLVKGSRINRLETAVEKIKQLFGK